MSIKNAANFASKMNKEKQHTFYQCCRISADHYGVSATDVQKELASRGGMSSNGRKYKHVVTYRVPIEKVEIRQSEISEKKDFYFTKIKTTTKPNEVVNQEEGTYVYEEYNIYCKVFDSKKEAQDFSDSNLKLIKDNVIVLEDNYMSDEECDRMWDEFLN